MVIRQGPITDPLPPSLDGGDSGGGDGGGGGGGGGRTVNIDPADINVDVGDFSDTGGTDFSDPEQAPTGGRGSGTQDPSVVGGIEDVEFGPSGQAEFGGQEGQRRIGGQENIVQDPQGRPGGLGDVVFDPSGTATRRQTEFRPDPRGSGTRSVGQVPGGLGGVAFGQGRGQAVPLEQRIDPTMRDAAVREQAIEQEQATARRLARETGVQPESGQVQSRIVDGRVVTEPTAGFLEDVRRQREEERERQIASQAFGGVIGATGDVASGMPGAVSDFVSRFGGSDEQVEFTPDPFPGQETITPQAAARERQEFLQLAEENPGPIAGPAGDIEQTVLGPITGPASETEKRITGEIEERTQFLLGPPGERERAIGGGVADVTQGFEWLGETISEEVIVPGGEFAGRVQVAPATATLKLFGEEETAEDVESAAESFFGGVGRVPQDVLAAPEGARQLSELAFGGAQDVAVTAGSGELTKAGEMASFGLGMVPLQAGESLAGEIAESPFESAGALVGGFLVGSSAARALERGVSAARLGLIRRRTAGEFDVEDLTEEEVAEALAQGRTDVLPTFETPPGAPTREAVEEFRERGEDVPEELQEAVGSDVVTFRSETGRLGRDFEVQPSGEGGFELTGLFVSPDLSPLRFGLPGTSGGTLSSLSPSNLRLPRLRGVVQRASAFETPDVRGIPGQRGMRGETEFLEETAERGNVFVRGGTRSRELEGLFPPGSAFQRQSVFSVDIPGRGRGGTLDVFRRTDVDAPDADADDVISGEEIIRRERLSRRLQETEPVGPPLAGPTGAGSTTGSTTTDPFGMTTFPTTPSESFLGGIEVAAPTAEPTPTEMVTQTPSSPFTSSSPVTSDVAAPTEAGGVSDPIASVGDPTGLFTGTPTGPSETTTGVPTEPSPPSQPPSQPPTTGPPTTPPTGPPTRPPTLGPPTIGPPTSPPFPPSPPTGPPPQRPPMPESEPDRDEEEFQPLLPTGQEFVNPVATGSQFLFGNSQADAGGATGGQNGENPDPTGLFLG